MEKPPRSHAYIGEGMQPRRNVLAMPTGLYNEGSDSARMLFPVAGANGESLSLALQPPIMGVYVQADVGGNLPASTNFFYRVSAFNAFGETLANAETSGATGVAAPATHTMTLNWARVENARGYKVYGRTAGAELLIATVNGNNSLTFTDTGLIAPAGALPGANTTAPGPAGVIEQGNNTRITNFTRGVWIYWTYLSRADVVFRFLKNNRPFSDWLPTVLYANEIAVAPGVVAQFRPQPLIVYSSFDGLEIASPNGVAAVNAMIGVGGSEAM